jgi:hypothetical protein
MSNKFHQNALAEYSRSYARRVSTDFYSNHAVISGKQILNLTPIGQINIFVINSLFDKWKADAEKFRSPYFDFAHPEVEEALRGFMNVVSQHIAIRREHLEPMLAEAVRKTLILIFDPRNYFDDVLRNQPDFTLTAETAKQITRYTQINKFVPATIEQRINGKSFVYVNQALNFLEEVLSQRAADLEKPDKYVAVLSEKVPLDLTALIRSYDPDQLVSPQASRSFFDTELDPKPQPSPESYSPPAALPNRPAMPAVLVPPTDPYRTDSRSEDNSPDEAPTNPNFVRSVSYQDADLPNDVVMPNQFSPATYAPPASVETVATPVYQARADIPAAPASVGEAFNRAPIESIAKSISLNQKFRFINQLFNGHTSAYEQAMAELDKMANYGQALDLISYRYASQYLWDMSSDEVSELVEILKRRFA